MYRRALPAVRAAAAAAAKAPRAGALRALSSDLHMRDGWVLGTAGKPPASTPLEDSMETEESIIVGGERPGRIARHNLGIAACGVVGSGVNNWGNPSAELLAGHMKGKMTVPGAGGPALTYDDDEAITAVRDILSGGMDLYAVFGSVGAYGPASLPVAFVTDSPDAALVASTLFHSIPDNMNHKVPVGPLHVLHTSRVEGLATLSFEDADTRANLAIGAGTSVATIMDAIVQAAGDLAPEGTLPVAGAVLAETEGSTLIVGADDGSTGALAGSGKLYAAGGAIVHPDGVTAMFNGALGAGGDGVKLADGTVLTDMKAANLAYFPTKVALVGASGSLDAEGATAAFESMTNAADAAVYSSLLGGVPAVGVSNAKAAI